MVKLRPALPNEAGLLTLIAQESRKHFIGADAAEDANAATLRITPRSIVEQPTCVAESDGKVTGFCALKISGTRFDLRIISIRPEDWEHGFSDMLMEWALQYVADHGGTELLIDVMPEVENYYLTLGAERIGSVPAPIVGYPDRVRPQLKLAVGAMIKRHGLPPV
jgi:hypothetical protein